MTLGSLAFSQQLPLFSQYREMQGIINPASVYCDQMLYRYSSFVGVSYRAQWAGVPDAPRTQSIRGEHLFEGDGFSLVAGGHIMNDRAGKVGFTGAYARVTGILSDDPYEWGLAVGLTAGAIQYRVNLADANPRDPGDVLATESQNQIFPDVGAGVYFYKTLYGNEDIFYTGLSIPQVLGLDLRFRDQNSGDEFSLQQVRHYYGVAGYYLTLNDEYSFLEASTWVKYVPNVPVNVNLNLRYQMSNVFWVGGGWSTSQTFHGEAGLILGENIGLENQLKIGYGFDAPFSALSPYYGNSHEINLSLAFGASGWY